MLCKGIKDDTGGFIIARIWLKDGLPDGVTIANTVELEGLDKKSLSSIGDVVDPVWSSERGPWSFVSQAVLVWNCRLQPAHGLAVDRSGNFYVSNQIANQVWKYSSSGELLLKIGKEKGQQSGKFEPNAMRTPMGIDIRYENGTGHLVVAERVVWQRVSQWSLDGRFERDWMVSAYAFPAAVDEEDPKYIYVTGDWTGTVRYLVNYKTGEWKLDAVWPNQPGNPGDGPIYGNSMSARMRIFHLNNRTFLVSSSAMTSHYIYEVDGYRLIPTSALGYYMFKVFADKLNLNLYAKYPVVKLAVMNPPQDLYFPCQWTWHDANGDGNAQPEEFDFSSSPVFTKYQNAGEVGRAFSSYWGEYYDKELNLLLPEAGGSRYAIIPRTGWDKYGNPVYSWKNMKILFNDNVLESEGQGDPGFGALAKDDDGAYYRTEFYGPASPGGVDHGADYSFAKLMKFIPDGKAGFKLSWRIGKHAAGIAQSGEMYVPSQVSEPINNIVGVHDLNGLFHLFSTDGLYLDTITNDRFANSSFRTVYDLDGEMFGGRMFYNKEDKQAYLLQGHKAVSIFRIENLTSEGIVQKIPNTSKPFTLLAAQISPASEYALEKKTPSKPLMVIMPASGEAPALDGSMSGWSQSKEVKFFLDDNHKVEARVMYDLSNIYLRYHVRTFGVPKSVSKGSLMRCFTHESHADVLGFYIQGDTLADPVRINPVSGDVRFILTLVSEKNAEPKPVVLGMYGVYPGGTNPVTYVSPIGKIKFEEVKILSDAKAGYVLDKDGKGFTIAAAIPLSAIPKFSPKNGLVTAMNFDAVFSSGVRVWWSNTGVDRGATLMSDEFSEARIYPQIWGQAQFADPSRFIVNQWSVIGPFGSSNLYVNGSDPSYVLKNLAAMRYPPEENIDLKAVYTSPDIIRSWRGVEKKLVWKQVESGDGGWLRFDHAFQLSGDDSRGVAFANTWVYSPVPVDVRVEVEGHGICWSNKLWVNGRELNRELMKERGDLQFKITHGQTIELVKGWNHVLFRSDSYAHNWLFENAGGWGFRLVIGGEEKNIWGLKCTSVK